jgi:hypothetical protein
LRGLCFDLRRELRLGGAGFLGQYCRDALYWAVIIIDSHTYLRGLYLNSFAEERDVDEAAAAVLYKCLVVIDP